MSKLLNDFTKTGLYVKLLNDLTKTGLCVKTTERFH